MKPHWLMPAGLHTTSAQLPVEGRLPSFEGATGWLNSPPLTADGLRGKVVLVNFWTYTCINWLRQLPYVRAWAGKYAAQGLVVIGVILLIAGAIAFVAGLFMGGWGFGSRMRTERHVSPDGRHVVEDSSVLEPRCSWRPDLESRS